MTLVHLIGAQFCFVVYLVCEFVSLYDPANRDEIGPGERAMRKILFFGGAIAMVTFAIAYGILFIAAGPSDTPYTLWGVDGRKDMFKISPHKSSVLLIRPASGFWKVLKVTSYVAEYSVAATILFSHMVIWWFFSRNSRLSLSR